MIKNYRIPLTPQDPRMNAPLSVAGGIDVKSVDGNWPTRDLVNVDVPNGVIRSRGGYSLHTPTEDPAHSLTLTPDGSLLYGVKDKLMIQAHNQPPRPVGRILSSNVSYTRFNRDVWGADGGLFQVLESSIERPEVLTPPKARLRVIGDTPPTKDTVGVAISITNKRGLEGYVRFLGVTPLPSGVELLEGLLADDLTLNVYVTEPGGGILRITPGVGNTSALYPIAVGDEGRVCAALEHEPMCGGKFITYHGSRLITADEDYLYYSKPFSPHLMEPTGFIPFKSIKFIQGVGKALIVADSKGIWSLMGQDIEDASLVQISKRVAYTHSNVVVPSSVLSTIMAPPGQSYVVFCSDAGFCAISESGEVVELQADRVSLHTSGEGRSVYYKNRGIDQVICTTPNKPLHGYFSVADDYS